LRFLLRLIKAGITPLCPAFPSLHVAQGGYPKGKLRETSLVHNGDGLSVPRKERL